jgi:hypothetical protein
VEPATEIQATTQHLIKDIMVVEMEVMQDNTVVLVVAAVER